ncbi:MAG: DUF2306 domain-containing protein [Rhodospirillaceae bacterium]|nr:DUF2306 domain-containing protein [Rhodospirillaceae bacterium]
MRAQGIPVCRGGGGADDSDPGRRRHRRQPAQGWLPARAVAAWRTLPLLVLAVLAIPIGVVALRYVEADPGLLPAGLRVNFLAHPIAFVAHTTAGGLALLLTPVQLSAWLRRRHPKAHRWLGRVYVAACTVAGLAGLRIAFGTAYGPVAAAGFAALALAWLATTLRGVLAARAGDFPRHRAWMVRSAALTCAAVTLRLELIVLVDLRLDFSLGYPAVAWLSWLPNLALAEAWLRTRAAPRRARGPATPATRQRPAV